MNVHAKSGDKVVYLDEGGHEFQRVSARKILKKYHVYTVDRTDVSDFHTDLFLKEFPDELFNSVMFDDYETEDRIMCNPLRHGQMQGYEKGILKGRSDEKAKALAVMKKLKNNINSESMSMSVEQQMGANWATGEIVIAIKAYREGK